MKRLLLFFILLMNILAVYSQISVTVDSIRQKTDTIYISDRKGSVCYMRTSGDSLYLGDISGEIYLGIMTQGGSSIDTLNTRIIRLNTTIPMPSYIEGQYYYNNSENSIESKNGFFCKQNGW